MLITKANDFNRKSEYCLNCGVKLPDNLLMYCDSICANEHMDKIYEKSAESSIKSENRTRS